MTRIAHCSCGSLRAEVTGEPALVVGQPELVKGPATASPIAS